MTEFLGWGVAVKIAERFHRLIRIELKDHLREIDDLNARQTDCCATHLWTDPNELMGEAFASVVGRDVDVQSAYDMAAFDVAWGIARRRGFSLSWEASA